MRLRLPLCIAAALCAAVLSLSPVPAADSANTDTIATPEQIQAIQDFSVTIHAGSAQGSGVIKTRGDTNYVWTAGHVVADLRSTRPVIDRGAPKTVVEFKDAKIVKELVEDGRSVGRLEMDAEILRYSNADTGEDLALLRVRKKNFERASVRFDLDDQLPPIGTRLLHCGSLLGQTGSNSLTSGIISQNGRLVGGKTFTQSSCPAFPGSSGGGVFREKDSKYVGMLVRGAGETFNLYVPMRRIKAWAKKTGVEFALDDKVAVPTEEQLKKLPIEDIGARFESPVKEMEPAKGVRPAADPFPFLIHHRPGN